MVFYGIFVGSLLLGYIASIITSILYGLFVLIQVVITFEQLLRYANKRLPGCVLGATSFQSMIHQLLHIVGVFVLKDLITSNSNIWRFTITFIVLGSLFYSNVSAWLLNAQMKSKSIDLNFDL